MAEYWRVSPKIWLHNSWDDRVKLLALYILTCPHRTTEGLFRLPKQYICADLGWDMEALAKPFARLIQDGFIEYDEENQVMFICKALKYQRPDNPNQQQAAINKLSQLPPTPLWPRFLAAAQAYAEPFAQALRKAFPQAIPKGIGNSPAPAPPPPPAPTQAQAPTTSTDTNLPPMVQGASGETDRQADADAAGNSRRTGTERSPERGTGNAETPPAKKARVARVLEAFEQATGQVPTARDREVAAEMLALIARSGHSVEQLSTLIREEADAFRPTSRHRYIRSLAYFLPAVRALAAGEYDGGGEEEEYPDDLADEQLAAARGPPG